jgi:hypothetical protein
MVTAISIAREAGARARTRIRVVQESFVRHRFRVGESVRFISGPSARAGAGGSYKVVRVLPSEGDEQLYRIKSASEPHERVARESQLDPTA